MENARFRKELEETIKYANRHAADFYELHGKNFNKIFSIDKNDFNSKCYEGFKLAQDKIINNILKIEDELISEERQLNNFVKGKRKKNLEKNKIYIDLKQRIETLNKQKYAFQDIANVIVWTIFKGQGTYIRSFLKEGGGSGYLRDRDIEASIREAKKLNESKNTFTIINDITSCLHSGDLITVGVGTMRVIELKSGKINSLVNKIVHDYLKNDKFDMDAMEKLHNESPKYGFKQLKRQIKQVLSFFRINQYMTTDQVYDPILENKKTAITILTKDLNYNEKVDLALDEFDKNNKDYSIFVSDCCVIGTYRNNGKSDYVRQMNFKHEIYHLLFEPWERCQYENLENIKYSEDNPPEIFKYQKFKINLLEKKIKMGGYEPLYLTLKEKHITDLLTEKISIYIFFDYNEFFEICKEKGLNPEWVSVKDYGKEKNNKNDHKILPAFEGKYLKFSYKKIKSYLAYGTFFRIVYNFQSGNNIADQIKEEFWVLSHPRLSKIRNYLYFYFYRTHIKWRFCMGRLNKKTRHSKMTTQ